MSHRNVRSQLYLAGEDLQWEQWYWFSLISVKDSLSKYRSRQASSDEYFCRGTGMLTYDWGSCLSDSVLHMTHCTTDVIVLIVVPRTACPDSNRLSSSKIPCRNSALSCCILLLNFLQCCDWVKLSFKISGDTASTLCCKLLNISFNLPGSCFFRCALYELHL